jgi:hypothetical protein
MKLLPVQDSETRPFDILPDQLKEGEEITNGPYYYKVSAESVAGKLQAALPKDQFEVRKLRMRIILYSNNGQTAIGIIPKVQKRWFVVKRSKEE